MDEVASRDSLKQFCESLKEQSFVIKDSVECWIEGIDTPARRPGLEVHGREPDDVLPSICAQHPEPSGTTAMACAGGSRFAV